MSNLNDGFNERPVDPPESFDMGGHEECIQGFEREIIDDDLSHFFTRETPSKVIDLINRAWRLRASGQTFHSERVLSKALELLIETHAEQNEVIQL